MESKTFYFKILKLILLSTFCLSSLLSEKEENFSNFETNENNNVITESENGLRFLSQDNDNPYKIPQEKLKDLVLPACAQKELITNDDVDKPSTDSNEQEEPVEPTPPKCVTNPQRAQNMHGFVCLPYGQNQFMPVRRNMDGHIEIFSHNARDAIWGKAKTLEECENYVKANYISAHPLVCGDMHIRVHGSNGYDQEGHWCNHFKNVPELKDNLFRWYCIGETGIETPVRLNYEGEYECLSNNDRDCWWGLKNDSDCRRAVSQMAQSGRHLSCGLEHLRTYGGNGYFNPVHWCHIASKKIPSGECCPRFQGILINDWECLKFPAGEVAVRMGRDGHPQCFSLNGRDCAWNKPNCWQFVNDNKTRANPLICGENHKRHYGGTGYDVNYHWCYQAKDHFNTREKRLCKNN